MAAGLQSPSPEPPGKRKARASGFFNAAVGLVALLVIVPLALQASHEPPPSVAEFAPQVQTQIKQAPNQQSSEFGRGAGGSDSGPAGGSPPSPPASSSSSSPPPPPPKDVPAALLKHCVGDPPRQIEDAQSPPCIPYWQGDNGGATAKGVSHETIYLAEPTDCQTATGQGESYLEYNDLVAFFNKRFEFYGRTVVPYCYQTGNGSASQATEESDADNIAANPTPQFAATMYRSGDGRYFTPRLSCVHHIIDVTYYLNPLTTAEMHNCPGYIYQYTMDFDTEASMLGQWTCSRLVPGNAVHAGGNDNATPPRPMASDPRKFGIIFQPFYNDEPGAVKPLRDQLALCGVNIPDRDVLVDPVVDPTAGAVPEDPSQAGNAMLQLKNDGVTSVLCLCNMYTYGAFTRAADSQRYYPEWLGTSYGGLDNTVFAQDLGSSPPDQLQHLFGLSFRPRVVPPQEEPYYQAMREVDPGNTPKGPDSVDVEVDQEVYHNLLMLMSGFQMAGPNLTPKSFGDGLARTAFPNPDTPLREGHVGFGGYTYSMTTDGAEFWYGIKEQSPYPDTSGSGAICYVEDGRRYTAGHWPRGGDPFFTTPCNGVT
ncbi:MAG: hypothetical protein ABR573_03620 [Candidatus Dormibacteria bacterium]